MLEDCSVATTTIQMKDKSVLVVKIDLTDKFTDADLLNLSGDLKYWFNTGPYFDKVTGPLTIGYEHGKIKRFLSGFKL